MRGEHRSMSARDRAVRVVLVVMVAAIAGACASGDAAKRVAGTPIESVASIAGTWTGTLEFGSGEQPCTLTIEPGGHASIQGRSITAHGSVSVNQGKGAYSFPRPVGWGVDALPGRRQAPTAAEGHQRDLRRARVAEVTRAAYSASTLPPRRLLAETLQLPE